MCNTCRAIAAISQRKRTVLGNLDKDASPEQTHRAWALLCAGTNVEYQVAQENAHLIAAAHLTNLVPVIKTTDLADRESVTRLLNEIDAVIAGTYIDGMLTGELVPNPPKPSAPKMIVFDGTGEGREINDSKDLYALLQESVLRARRARRVPLWTRCCEGVREAERDRRRLARRRP